MMGLVSNDAMSPLMRPPRGLSGLNPLRITDVRVIRTARVGTRLAVVKVETSEPGLYGIGCARFSQRADAVAKLVDDYLKPFIFGRDPDDIEDIWQACHLCAYWRGGPLLNSALSGVDQALWDIKGNRAGMPVHQLLGGRCRRATDVYVHIKGRDFSEIEDRTRAYMERGFRYVRCQPYAPGRLSLDQPDWDPPRYIQTVPRTFEHLGSRLGEEIELIHDGHERLSPPVSVQFAKELKLFNLEDPFAPEDNDHLRILKNQSSIPLAMGERCASEREYVLSIRDRLIDFAGVHVSAIGGLTPARKLAALAGYFGVRTSWHGPRDVSPVGHAAQLHLDLAIPNFGVQETYSFGDAAREVFPGMPEIRDEALWSNEKPGPGVDVDETAAAKYPFPDHPLNGSWTSVRLRDGSLVRH